MKKIAGQRQTRPATTVLGGISVGMISVFASVALTLLGVGALADDGDTVSDPFKDTSGPSMNILLKVMTIVSLVFASAFV